MENLNLSKPVANMAHLLNAPRPVLPSTRQPIVETRLIDPSSSNPKGEHYPIPAFFEYRSRGRDFDPL